MVRKSKREMTRHMPPLCVAVKRVRKAYGETLEEFGRRVRVSITSISRFELGKTSPSDFNVHANLARAARDRRLTEESELFLEAQHKARFRAYRGPSPGEETIIAPTYTPQEWRLMQAVRIAIRLFPENVRAIEKAAGPAVALVDEILRSADAAVLGPAFYAGLEQRLNELANQRAFEILKQERE
jgi:transcriptional regulator with XRE-family HTH domain